MATKLALCIISNHNDLSSAQQLGEKYKEFVDEVVITVADKKKPFNFKWDDDFATARTFNFSETQADWILWLDADDTLDHPEKLKELIEYAEARRLSGYFFKYKYGFDENGNCIDEHWKLQLVKNDSG